MISYILTLIISFAGAISGGVLAMMAREELKAGEKYWKIMRLMVLVIIIAVIIYFSRTAWAALIVALLAALALLKKEYPAMAFVLLLSYFEGFLFIAGSLIFIYGLPEGTVQAKKIIGRRAKTDAKMIRQVVLGVLKNNVLYLIFGLVLLPLILAYA